MWLLAAYNTEATGWNGSGREFSSQYSYNLTQSRPSSTAPSALRRETGIAIPFKDDMVSWGGGHVADLGSRSAIKAKILLMLLSSDGNCTSGAARITMASIHYNYRYGISIES